QALGLPDALGAQLVHRQRRGQHAAAGVWNAEPFEDALHRAVFAEAAVQRDEHALEALLFQGGEVALLWIERVGVDAFRTQRLEHHAAAFEGDLALGRLAAQQHGNLAELHSASPTMRTSVCSSTPFIW